MNLFVTYSVKEVSLERISDASLHRARRSFATEREVASEAIRKKNTELLGLYRDPEESLTKVSECMRRSEELKRLVRVVDNCEEAIEKIDEELVARVREELYGGQRVGTS